MKIHISWLWVGAITLFPFIFYKKKPLDEIFVNHERIHLRQQLELLIIPFYIWYYFEYLISRFKGYNKVESYYRISFEREAYAQERNLNYLQGRKMFSFIEFL